MQMNKKGSIARASMVYEQAKRTETFELQRTERKEICQRRRESKSSEAEQAPMPSILTSPYDEAFVRGALWSRHLLLMLSRSRISISHGNANGSYPPFHVSADLPDQGLRLRIQDSHRSSGYPIPGASPKSADNEVGSIFWRDS